MTGLPLSGTADGTHTIHLIATDTLGNVSKSYDDTFLLDTTPPVVSYSGPPPGSPTRVNPTVIGVVADALSGVASLQGQLDGGPTFPVTLGPGGAFSFATAMPLDGTADGPHTIHLVATDTLGNVSNSYDDSFVLDTTPPVVSYSTPAPGSATRINPTVSGVVTDLTGVAQLQAGVNGGTLLPVTLGPSGSFSFVTGLPLNGTADGSHTVHLVATDILGNVSSSYDDTFVLDTTPPVVSYSAPAPDSTEHSNPTVAGVVADSLSGVASLQGQVDGGATFPVTFGLGGAFSFATALPLDGTADGAHTVHLVATDAAGNVSASYDDTFVLDTTAPKIAYTSPAPASFTRTNPTVAGQVTSLFGVTSLQGQVDAGSTFPVSFDASGDFSFVTGLPLDGTADGTHTVHLVATDTLGNVSNSYDDSFVIDTTPPVVSYSAPAPGSTAYANPTISGVVTDALSGVASLQGQVNAGPTFPVSFDASGDFRFPTTLPLDGTADGSHTVHLVATDQVGNTSASYDDTFVLNTTAPKIAYTSPAPGSFTRTNPTVAGQVTSVKGLASLQGQVNAGPTFPVSFNASGDFSFVTGLPLDGTADGSHTIHLVATDKVGNISDTYDDTFVLDTTPPVVYYSAPAPDSTVHSNPTISGEVTDALSGVASLQGQVDGGATFPVGIGPSGMFLFTPTLPLDGTADGPHTFHLVATDKAGNVSASYDDTFVLDTSVPMVLYTNLVPGSVFTTDPTVTGVVTRSAKATLVQAQIDSGPLFTVTPDASGDFSFPTTLPLDGSADGQYTIHMYVTDDADNLDLGPFDASFVLDTVAPTVTVTESASRVAVGSPVTITVSATDDVSVASLGLTVGGVPVALNASDQATITAGTLGLVPVVGTATDEAGNVGTKSVNLIVYDPNDHTPPTISFTVGDGSPITAPTAVTGTVSDPSLISYELDAIPIAGGPARTIFTGTSSVVNGQLGTFDPTMLTDDSYVVQMTATDASGNTITVADPSSVDVAGNLKLGNFTLSFNDLTVPVAGIPITVTRTYDTLDSGTSEDFGYGWRLEYSDTDLRTNVAKTGYEDDGIYNPFLDGTRVYVTVPGGQREGFTFTPQLAPGLAGSFLGILLPSFTSDPGVTDTLSVDSFDLRQNDDGTYSDYLGDLPYNPSDDAFGGVYTLTTKDGTVCKIDGDTGKLDTIADRSGNTLTFTADGITSTSGAAVTFQRDAEGRITTATDPSGQSINYTYDATGDLVSVIDRQGNTTKFDYLSDPTHYLEDVIDPLGRVGARTDYDAAGRLTQVTDASGHTVNLGFAPGSDVETITDALGNQTTMEYDDQGNVITEIDALGGVTRRTYDSNNNKLTETDPLGNTTTYTYDSRGNLITMTDPLGRVTRYTYDSGNDLIATDGSSRRHDDRHHGRARQRPDGDRPAGGRRRDQHVRRSGIPDVHRGCPGSHDHIRRQQQGPGHYHHHRGRPLAQLHLRCQRKSDRSVHDPDRRQRDHGLGHAGYPGRPQRPAPVRHRPER